MYPKVGDASRGEYEAAGSHPLGYQTAGEDRALKSYLEVPATILEDDERLRSMPGRPTGHPIDRRNQAKGLG
jgi:DNA transformation protein